jgi:hypothetical protein
VVVLVVVTRNSAVQANGLCMVCVMALLGKEGGGEYSSLPATKVDKRMMHQSTSTAGVKEVGGKAETPDKSQATNVFDVATPIFISIGSQCH